MSWRFDSTHYPGPAVQDSEVDWRYPGITYVNSRHVELSPTTSHPHGVIINCAKNEVTRFITYDDTPYGVREYTQHSFLYREP